MDPRRLRPLLLSLALAACAQPEYAPAPAAPQSPRDFETRSAPAEAGRISFYASDFAGRTTASGERFDPEALTMAHRTLAFGTRVRVTNLRNQRSVEVVVNDRGPFVRGRIADVSPGAARRLDMVDEGVVEARLEILAPGSR